MDGWMDGLLDGTPALPLVHFLCDYNDYMIVEWLHWNWMYVEHSMHTWQDSSSQLSPCPPAPIHTHTLTNPRTKPLTANYWFLLRSRFIKVHCLIITTSRKSETETHLMISPSPHLSAGRGDGGGEGSLIRLHLILDLRSRGTRCVIHVQFLKWWQASRGNFSLPICLTGFSEEGEKKGSATWNRTLRN